PRTGMRGLTSSIGGVSTAPCDCRQLGANEDSVTAARLRNERRGISKAEKNRGVFIDNKQNFMRSPKAVIPIAAESKRKENRRRLLRREMISVCADNFRTRLVPYF